MKQSFLFAAALCGIISLATPNTSEAGSVGLMYQRGLIATIPAVGEGGGIIATAGGVTFGAGAQIHEKGIWLVTAEVGAQPQVFGKGFFTGASITGVVYHDKNAESGVAKTRVRPGLYLPVGFLKYFEGKETALRMEIGCGFIPSRGENHWYPAPEVKARLTFQWNFGEAGSSASKSGGPRTIK